MYLSAFNLDYLFLYMYLVYDSNMIMINNARHRNTNFFDTYTNLIGVYLLYRIAINYKPRLCY